MSKALNLKSIFNGSVLIKRPYLYHDSGRNITIISNINMNLTLSLLLDEYSSWTFLLEIRYERRKNKKIFYRFLSSSEIKFIFMELFVWKNVNCFPGFLYAIKIFSIKLSLRKKKIIHDYFSFSLKRLCDHHEELNEKK